MALREEAIIGGPGVSSFVFHDIIALQNPLAPQRWQPLLHRALVRWITPWAACVIYFYWFI
jgi:hypothetical protein